jgi:hypothetical protein
MNAAVKEQHFDSKRNAIQQTQQNKRHTASTSTAKEMPYSKHSKTNATQQAQQTQQTQHWQRRPSSVKRELTVSQQFGNGKSDLSGAQRPWEQRRHGYQRPQGWAAAANSKKSVPDAGVARRMCRTGSRRTGKISARTWFRRTWFKEETPAV